MSGFPTILFINEAGKVEDTIGSYMPPSGFSQKMEEALNVHDFPTLLSHYKANPTDVAAVGKLIACYTAKSDISQATTMLAQLEKLDPTNSKGLMAKSYNSVGDYYQGKNSFDKAISYFRKAVKTGKLPYDIAYAHISTGECYKSENKRPQALAEFKATMATPHCPPDFTMMAQSSIAELVRSGGTR